MTIEFSRDWVAVGAIYGGRVVASLVDEADILPGFIPVSISAHFFGTVRAGAADVQTEVLHHGRTSATVRVTLVQWHPRAMAIVKLGKITPDANWRAPLDTRGLPDPDTLHAVTPRYGSLPYERFVELRLISPAQVDPYAEVRGWARLTEPEAIGSARTTPLMLDCLPPGAYSGHPLPSNVPTIDFTAHFAPSPAAGSEWHVVSQQLMWSGPDFCIEESTLSRADGSIVGRARQSRRIIA